jgi:ligand-binding sensor domain-containing protein
VSEKSLRRWESRARAASRGEVCELMRRFLAETGADEPFEWESFTSDNGLPHNWIYDIFQDSRGTIWVGTWGGGLARYGAGHAGHAGGSGRVYGKCDGLASAAVTCVREDAHGGIWAATNAGLNRLEGSRFVDAGLYGKSLLNICFDAEGRLWAGAWRASHSGGGLHRLEPDGGGWTAFSKRDGLPGLEILKVFEDSRGGLWVGTYDGGRGAGVGRWDGQRWRTFTERDGLVSDCVYGMFEDPDGHMWFGTTGGVSVYDGRG